MRLRSQDIGTGHSPVVPIDQRPHIVRRSSGAVRSNPGANCIRNGVRTCQAQDAEEARPYGERRDLGDVAAEVTADIRARFWKDGEIAENAHVTLDISDRLGAHALKRMLAILGRVPQDPIAIAAFTPREPYARRL